MAEAYKRETAGPYTVQAMLNDLALFLAYDPSWTVSKGTTDGSTGVTGDPIVIHKTNGTPDDDCRYHIWQGGATTIGLNLSKGNETGANGQPAWLPGSVWYDQPGARRGQLWNANAPNQYCRVNASDTQIAQYYFFGYGSYVYVVYQTVSGPWWRNFAFGHIDKITDLPGGGFCISSYTDQNPTYIDDANAGYYTQFLDPYGGASVNDAESHCSQIRLDRQDSNLRYILGANLYRWRNTGDGHDEAFGQYDKQGFSGNIYTNRTDLYQIRFDYDKIEQSPSAFGITAPLIPIYFYIDRGAIDAFENNWSIVGTLPNVLCLNIKGFTETQEITIQGNTWTVFPASKKSNSMTDGSNVVNSYHWGFCLRKPV